MFDVSVGAVFTSVVLALVAAPFWIAYWRLQAWLGARGAARDAQRQDARVMADIADFDRHEAEFIESLKAARPVDR